MQHAIDDGTWEHSQSKPNHEVGSYRICAPLFNFNIIEGGFFIHDRLQLTPNVFVAALDAAEQLRVAGATGERVPSSIYRLEIYGFATPSDDALQQVVRAIHLLALCVRVAPRIRGCTVDVCDGRVWRRKISHFLLMSVGAHPDAMVSTVPRQRVDTWASLLTNWPERLDTGLQLSIEYYYDSVAERQAHKLGKAFLATSVAFECLLGPNLVTELTHRLSRRGGLLVSAGPSGLDFVKYLKATYGTRSKLVHEGREPTMVEVVRLQQYLMRAIPSMVVLAKVLGGHAAAADALENEAFSPSSALQQLRSEGWWSFVGNDDLRRCLGLEPVSG